MSLSGIGVDIVEIKRFANTAKTIRSRFVSDVFTKDERAYCSAYRDSATHFAGTFAAKEAACKAFGGKYILTSFEIRRRKDGKPEVWRNRKKLRLALSISHEGKYAVAVCIASYV